MNEEWIDTRDKLPKEDGMLVVVFDPTNHPTVWPAKWSEEHQSFHSEGGWFEADEVTHWMPLPEAPKSPHWVDGFKAAEKDSENNWSGEYTHNPHQPTSPYTYPDYHCGPASEAAHEWETGYDYFRTQQMGGYIQLKLTHRVGNQLMEFIL